MAKSRSPAAEPHRFISIRGAREHNLKNVDVDLPRDRLVVITGLSGSGKSSLAFDTIYAEGQRRYVESLSAYARQFLELMQKPDVDSIEGLSPAISIEQKTTSRNPRSTVGTVTEIYDYLRLLFARVGVPYSPATGLPIESQTVSQMVDRIMAMAGGHAALPAGARSCAAARASTARNCRSCRSRASSGSRSTASSTRSTRRPRSTRSSSTTSRWWSTASSCGPTSATGLPIRSRRRSTWPTASPSPRTPTPASARSSPPRFACPVSGFTIEEIEPRLFSFNNPHGACPACDGLGVKMFFDPELVVPDDRLSLARGRDRAVGRFVSASITCRRWRASPSTTRSRCRRRGRTCRRRCATRILYGSGGESVTMRYDDGLRHYQTDQAVRGRDPQPRPALARDRLRLGARGARALPAREPVRDLRRRPAEARGAGGQDRRPATSARRPSSRSARRRSGSSRCRRKLTPKQREIAARILKEINERLGFLDNVGLDYLTLAAPRARCRAARASASGWPRRSARA